MREAKLIIPLSNKHNVTAVTPWFIPSIEPDQPDSVAPHILGLIDREDVLAKLFVI